MTIKTAFLHRTLTLVTLIDNLLLVFKAEWVVEKIANVNRLE
ncbi:hypothetical protein [Marinoscillum furvescens]|uniref:Uncharacterized protein n=1 Tax=Marinoscillum furvescens DSM 4134 TaxID=1122208 RepID=A0A3D9L201_MARFU|nr:hypothetical protein [Marinoscillum furvescens]RED96025.1 hypothetical protein C7460_11683 [Marinoscillum furvescens DSM 4134]